jgi:hypothetical protein
MLWTDTDFINAADLITLDSEVQEVASAENIQLDDLTNGNGVIHRAIEEAADTILKHLQVFGGYLSSGAVSSNHYAAVMNIGLPAVNRSKILMGQVVVTGLMPRSWTALKRWTAYWALTVFYRDAANRTNNDRYRTKSENYRKQVHGMYWEAVRSTGIPVVRNPLPCPGALYELNAGTWGASNVSVVSGAGGVPGDWDVAITYVDGTKTVNNESAASAVRTVTVTTGNTIRVSLAGLTPPTGKQPAATIPMALVEYCKATGWNVYAAPTGEPLVLQNVSLLDINSTTYTMGAPVTTGTQVGTGQFAELYLSFSTMIQRG